MSNDQGCRRPAALRSVSAGIRDSVTVNNVCIAATRRRAAFDRNDRRQQKALGLSSDQPPGGKPHQASPQATDQPATATSTTPEAEPGACAESPRSTGAATSLGLVHRSTKRVPRTTASVNEIVRR